jgi:2-polyprenyl-3-methyl-5-hydroxy-6-metoxy-1,4-benzoquinol methylase
VVTQSDEESESSAYTEWKGWVEETPFGQLDAGEAAYFSAELKDVRAQGRRIQDVLEVGYGNGAFLSYCRQQGWNVSGTELGPDLVAAGRAAGFDTRGADELAAIADGSVDLIAVFDVLEHIPQDDIIDFLSTLSSKLRPGGVMLLRFPNADSWLGNAMQNGDPTHVTAIGYLKLTYFAQRCEMDVVRFRGAKRHGFKTSFVHGVYALVAGPVIGISASLKRALYFPGLPVVLSTSNVVCLLRPRQSA